MNDNEVQAVTGAFGYTGKYIAKRLIEKGISVLNLTNSPQRQNEFGNRIKTSPLAFNSPDELIDSLRGVSVLYNTYWVRFSNKLFRQSDAIKNTISLFDLAKAAGVRRIVHVSVTNPDENSPLEYFKGKAILEKALINTGISHAILRPALIFGREDILINNIAWLLRKFPFFAVPGDGSYRLQPIFAKDLAEIAISAGKESDNMILNCIGPETFSYRFMVSEIARILNINKRIICFPPVIVYMLGKMIGFLKNDVVLTMPEIKGLMDDLLYVGTEPNGKTKFTEWLAENSDHIGQKYTHELNRRIHHLKS